jgi:hypothetical protein
MEKSANSPRRLQEIQDDVLAMGNMVNKAIDFYVLFSFFLPSQGKRRFEVPDEMGSLS